MKIPTQRKNCPKIEPCPHVSCRYHLYLDVHPTSGTIKLNQPDKEVWELEHSCALTVADNDWHTLEEIGEILSITKERVRQIEANALKKLRKRIQMADSFLSYSRNEKGILYENIEG